MEKNPEIAKRYELSDEARDVVTGLFTPPHPTPRADRDQVFAWLKENSRIVTRLDKLARRYSAIA